jgi:predicted enzyme related to lactoylglutathione lyase
MKAFTRHLITKLAITTLATASLLAFTSVASAEVSMNATRVGAKEELAIAEFYKKAFGMHEVQRIDMQGGHVELMLNFGSNEAEAKANKGAQIVVMHSEEAIADDPIAHVIFNVTDAKGTAAAIIAAGGTMEREVFEYGNSGIMIGLARDPAGNRIELLQFPTQ